MYVCDRAHDQIDIFLFPLISAWVEHKLYGVRSPDYVGHIRRFFRRSSKTTSGSDGLPPLPDGVAVQVENLRKVYSSRKSGVGKKTEVVAIDDLSFTVPKVRLDPDTPIGLAHDVTFV